LVAGGWQEARRHSKYSVKILLAPRVRNAEQFSEQGFIQLREILSASECRQFLGKAASEPRPLGWYKGHAASSRAFYEIAAHREIVDVVAEVLGENVMLWGASVVKKAPGDIHPWHTDIESAACDGNAVSVWIGLENTTLDSSLTFVSYSHRFGVTVPEERQRRGKARVETSNIDILQWARARDERAQLLQLEMSDGDALFFDGRLWHSSNNLSKCTRRALLLQYATPATAVRIADMNYLDWPFRYLDQPLPPCVVVRGRSDADANRIVPAPAERASNE
jgi:ectoine hydroxylase-related dioxygenase (phytanoyl-CoA dioxygenase family)